jgi:hypothetical protein
MDSWSSSRSTFPTGPRPLRSRTARAPRHPPRPSLRTKGILSGSGTGPTRLAIPLSLLRRCCGYLPGSSRRSRAFAGGDRAKASAGPMTPVLSVRSVEGDDQLSDAGTKPRAKQGSCSTTRSAGAALLAPHNIA